MTTTIEIEQKFDVTNVLDLESKLTEIGFSPKETVTFVDWYFDTEDYHLTTKDYWLRFRDTPKGGEFQLKRGSRDHEQASSTTVYEEIEGDKAVEIAVSQLDDRRKMSADRTEIVLFDGLPVPCFPGPCNSNTSNLFPFSRIETTRKQWEYCHSLGSNNKYKGIKVDVDSTDTGYIVGEVEIVVNQDEDVNVHRERVQELTTKLVGSDNSANKEPAIGKLEHYLMTNLPRHYEACVKSGVIPSPQKR